MFSDMSDTSDISINLDMSEVINCVSERLGVSDISDKYFLIFTRKKSIIYK